jgi:uncharacterized protein
VTRRRTGRLAFFGVVVLVLAAAVATTALLTAPASAQDRPLTLFDLLFGRRQRFEQPPAPSPQHTRRPRPGSTSRAPGPGSAPAPAAVAKLGNARKVLVVGDFTAGALADGLTQAFANSPGVVVVDRSNGSSGFVRDDYYNWTARIPALLQQDKPAVVAVMIGSNDGQSLDVAGNRESVGTAAWTQEYTRRVQAFAHAIQSAGYPFVWVGEPAFQRSSVKTAMIAFNDIYRAAAEKDGGRFVDVWGGFVDDSGNFTTTGFDINGQTARLRSADGVNFTKEGRRKLAFYAEKPLRQILGEAAAPGITSLSPAQPAVASPGGAAASRVAPIAIDDPAFDGSAALMGGATQETVKAEKSARDKLVQDGIPPQSQPGRIDDYAWPLSAAGPDGSGATAATVPGK